MRAGAVLRAAGQCRFQALDWFLLSGLLLLLGACGQPAYQRIEGPTMGTRYHITFAPPGRTLAAGQVQAAVVARLEAINHSMSTWRDDSIISTFNRAPVGQPVRIDTDFSEVLELARKVHHDSAGAFDPAVAELVDLWGFGARRQPAQGPVIPDAQAIEAARSLARFSAVTQTDPLTLVKSAPVRLDFSAIAKGYAVDAVAAQLRELGVTHYMVEIGGEVAVSGRSARGGPWRIGIEAPQPARGRTLTVLNLHEAAMATSGDYRNHIEIDGQRYSHIIDPRTGYPVHQPPTSVTVLASSVALADAWATAFMVLDDAQAQALAQQHGLAVYWVLVDPRGELVSRSSPAMQTHLDAD